MDKNDKIKDITIEILKSIRDEIRGLREDTNARFTEMDARFEHMDERLGRIETDIRAIVSHFERDYMLLATKVGEVEGKLEAHLQQGR